MNYCVIDIETCAAPDATDYMPTFTAPSNYKDDAKIAESIARQQADWIANSALSALTGQILAIGVRVPGLNDGSNFFLYGDERDLLKSFWEQWLFDPECLKVGHNIFDFDLPFLQRRAWKHGIATPPIDLARVRDTMRMWSCGVYGQRITLDHLAQHLGVGRKTGDGEHFAALYSQNRDEALAYLGNDLELTEKCYLRMVGK